MKKLFIMLVVFLLALSMSGCAAKETAAKNAVEKILENAGVDADIDGDKVIIKGEDGQEITLGAGKWPTSGIVGHIPVFESGKIVSVMEAEDSLFIMIEDVSDKDFAAYLEEIKAIFTGDHYEMTTDTGLIYTASNDSGIGVMLTYEKEAGFSITVSKAETEEE